MSASENPKTELVAAKPAARPGREALVGSLRQALAVLLDSVAGDDLDSALHALRSIEAMSRSSRQVLLAFEGRSQTRMTPKGLLQVADDPNDDGPVLASAPGYMNLVSSGSGVSIDSGAGMAANALTEMVKALPSMMEKKTAPSVSDLVEAAARAKDAHLDALAEKLTARVEKLLDASEPRIREPGRDAAPALPPPLSATGVPPMEQPVLVQACPVDPTGLNGVIP